VRVEVELSGKDLRIRVRDDGPGFDALPPAGGIGLRNVRQRLLLLDDASALYLRNRAEGGAEVEIVLARRVGPLVFSPGAAAG
jgi:signal transduction histidine kinase